MVVGEALRFIDDKFTDGYGNFGGALWPARAALLLWWLISTLIAQQVATDDRFVQSILKRGSEITEEAVAGAMQTATVVRLALVESVSSLGFVVYVENAHRLDLYLFMGLTVLSLLFLRPTREKWDEVFRRIEIDHPDAILSSS